MFEHQSQPVLARELYLLRIARGLFRGLLILVSALGIGMVGYHVTEHMGWIDSFVNASMILSGMGPVSALNTSAGKIFAGCYALFSGLAFTAMLAFVFAPVFHRFLHFFHRSHYPHDKEEDNCGR